MDVEVESCTTVAEHDNIANLINENNNDDEILSLNNDKKSVQDDIISDKQWQDSGSSSVGNSMLISKDNEENPTHQNNDLVVNDDVCQIEENHDNATETERPNDENLHNQKMEVDVDTSGSDMEQKTEIEDKSQSEMSLHYSSTSTEENIVMNESAGTLEVEEISTREIIDSNKVSLTEEINDNNSEDNNDDDIADLVELKNVEHIEDPDPDDNDEDCNDEMAEEENIGNLDNYDDTGEEIEEEEDDDDEDREEIDNEEDDIDDDEEDDDDDDDDEEDDDYDVDEDDDVHENANINYIRNAHDKLLRDDNNKDDVQLVISSDEEEQIKKIPESIKSYPPKQNEILKNKMNRNRSYDSFDEYNNINDDDDDDDNDEDDDVVEDNYNNYDDDDNDDDDEEDGYEDNNENDDLMNDVFMLSNKNNTSGLSSSSSHKKNTTSVAEVKNYQQEEKAQYIKNYYEMKAVKRSVKWLNNKRTMQKHDIHASNRMPSTSQQKNNDVTFIGFGNHDGDTTKLQQEKYQQQQQKQQPNESNSLVLIEFEDSPEKQPTTASSVLLKSQLINNRESEKEMKSVDDKIIEIEMESTSSTQNQQEQQKQQQQHQDHLKHLQQKNQNENNKESYDNNDKNSSSLKNIIVETDVVIEKTDDGNNENEKNVISVDLLEIKENIENDQQVKNNTENNCDDRQRQQQANEKNEFLNSTVAKIAIKSVEEKEFIDNSDSKTEENKNKPLLQNNNSGNSSNSNDVNKKLEGEQLDDKKLNKTVEHNKDESIMDVDEDEIAKHEQNEDVLKEKTKITDDENNKVNAAEIITPIIKTTMTTTYKRKRSHSDCDENEYRREDNNSQNKIESEEITGVHPIKKLRAELESNYQAHNKILNDYIERTSNNSVNDIQKNINQLLIEIQTLNDMIKANEIEWENMIHLKKVKEEICCRLTRKKHLKEIMSTKCGETNDDNNFIVETSEMRNDENQNDLHQKQQQQQQQQQSQHQQILTEKLISSATNSMITSTPNHNNSVHNNYGSNCNNNLKAVAAAAAATASSITFDDLMMMNTELSLQNHQNQYENSTNLNKKQQEIPPQSMSITQSILQSRANMKSSDLAKKRSCVEHIHRNILPKPSSSSLLFGPIGMNSTSSSGLPTTPTAGPATTLSTTPVTSLTNVNQIPTTSMSSNENLLKTSLALCAATSSGNNSNNNMKINTNHHHIQPTILNSYLTAEATVQQQLEEMLNGHHRNSQINNFYNNQKQKQQDNSNNSSVNNTNGDNKNIQQPIMIGRQGIFKDVKSIIADYRQKHPEVIPRRGRRLKGSSNGNSNSSAIVTEANSILGNVLKSDSGKITVADYNNSRPSSNDSSHSMTNILGSSANNTNLGNLSFKDVLVQFAKMSRQIAPERQTKSGLLSGGSMTQSTTSTMPPYPEVTLHPVVTSQSNTNEQTTGSLLHGILTKQTKSNNNTMAAAVASTSAATNNQNMNYKNEYSPTLARLLTAPDRTTSNSSNNGISFPISSSGTGALHSTGGNSAAATAAAMAAAGLNLSKVVGQNSEITITPVTSQSSMQQSLLQQQQRQQQHEHQQHQEFLRQQQHLKELMAKERIMCMDDEADDSVDRLIIDEGGDSAGGGDECHRIAPHAIGQEFHENEVPICQGCKKQEAQFVCAGCGNQWYCSRDCQVAAWDEHSEICTG